MNEIDKVLLSSKSNEWETPQDLYDGLNEIYKFTLDPCSTHENHKCDKYYTQEDNGLAQDWSGETVFMNPPYGREIGKWIKKAYEESLKGATVVCLIPARTDTSYWHDYCMKGEIKFIRGRLKFVNRETPGITAPAPFPSAIVIFNGGTQV